MITTDLKQRIIEALIERRANFSGSDAKFAITLGINNAQYSRIKNGDHDKVLSDQNWLSIARRLEIPIGNAQPWKTAETPVFSFITAQLEFCQKYSTARLLCDISNIGKTYTAKHYVRSTKNAIYVDCSQVKKVSLLVRFMAKEFGVGHTGRLSDVRADLVFYLRSLPSPLIILDEAGDLEYEAFKELKSLWNATEDCCGWYMMGADGLREKMRKFIDGKKVGYTEMFTRYGNKYQKATPDSKEELKQFISVHAALIIKANCTKEVNIQKLILKSDYSLRRIKEELRKLEDYAR